MSSNSPSRDRSLDAQQDFAGRRLACLGNNCSTGRPTIRRISSSRPVAGEQTRAHGRAVAEHRVAIRQLEDLLEPVRDEQQRAAGIPQLAGDAEQFGAFALRQRGGGLIEDQHARFVDQRARDLHHVLLRDAQCGHRRLRR